MDLTSFSTGLPSLLNICICTIASHLGVTKYLQENLCKVREPDLAWKIYKRYKQLCAAGESTGDGERATQLEVLLAFGYAFWQPQRLRIQSATCSSAALQQLWYVSQKLQHLEVIAPAMSDLGWLLQLRSPLSITCLSLRGCSTLAPSALTTLQLLPQLTALDLSSMPQVDDTIGGQLAALSGLQVLCLNETRCGDATVAALTYGQRMHSWSTAHHASIPEEARVWPRTQIHQWHLSRTHVTEAAMPLLLGLAKLTFCDMRGTGIRAGALQPLQKQFALRAVQGAVLSQSVALAAAILNHCMFVCGCGGLGAALPSSQAWLEKWAQEGAADIVSLADHVVRCSQRRDTTLLHNAVTFAAGHHPQSPAPPGYDHRGVHALLPPGYDYASGHILPAAAYGFTTNKCIPVPMHTYSA